ncbi:MAG TPA: SDR family oxidoreductase [Solirubrobacter sp.]|nr:SDR family oxidoreductase [Solirubrobacter sp.]
MKIVVIGGTGLIGSQVVTRLGEHGHEAVAASPDTGVNTLTGAGLAEALEGADVVVDVSNSPSFEDAAVLEFFERSTGNLLAAEAAAGVGHHVALSVVGTERMADKGYFKAKSVQEALIRGASVPYSIVHATQFFEFLKSIAALATDGDTVRLPPVRFQPIASEDVAKAVGRTAAGAPVNGIVEVAGPERFRMDELVRRALRARKDPRTVVADPEALYFGAYAVDDTTLVPGGDALLGEVRFQDWLERQLAAA